MSGGLDAAAFNAFFDAAEASMFRWEGRRSYAVPADDASMSAFREGRSRPERSVRTSPWLRRIALQTAAGVDWSRVRALPDDLTEYDDWSLPAYAESQACGEHVGFVSRGVSADDFWLRDIGTPNGAAVRMLYDDDGHLLERRRVDHIGTVATLSDIAQYLRARATPLNVWLAERRNVHA